ncbi:histidine phosphatase family protein [Neobacillus sp. K501]
MRITLIRHLPTEWNRKTWLQGRRDIDISPLADTYLAEMEENQRILGLEFPFDKVLASTLKRTHQTAQHYGFQCETESLLDELDFGPYEGQPKEKLMETYGAEWLENPRELILGESIQNLEKRIVTFLNKYRSCPKLLVFGHGSWIRAFLSFSQFGHINNMNKIEVPNNACITVQIREGKGC